MKFKKLSKIKQQIVASAYKQDYVTDATYPHQKQWLVRRGWLQGYSPDGVHIWSGCLMLTQAARNEMHILYELMESQS